MHVTVQQLADLVGGQLSGDGSVVIQAASPLADAQPGHITFLENDKHAHELPTCRASAIVVKPDVPANGKPFIRANDPFSAFLAIFRHLHVREEPLEAGIDSRAYIHPTAKLGADVMLQPFASVGANSIVGDHCRIHSGVVIGRNCRIGDDVTLHPHVVLYDGCTIGNRVVIHANSVVGSDGFGYRLQNGRHAKVPQLGSVEIADDVEIGACTTIDRGTFQATRIGEGTKIDNLVQVAHNCRVGRHNLFVGQVGLAGSCTTGDYVVMAGQVGLADHIVVGDRAVLGARAGVSKDVPPDVCLIGTPAVAPREFATRQLHIDKIPELRKEIKAIKKHLGME